MTVVDFPGMPAVGSRWRSTGPIGHVVEVIEVVGAFVDFRDREGRYSLGLESFRHHFAVHNPPPAPSPPTTTP